MKRTLFLTLCIALVSILQAQTKPKPKTSNSKPVAKPISQPILKNLADSAGYALGVDVASSLVAQNMTKINRPLITRGLNDAMDDKKMLIGENDCFMVLNSYANKMRESKGKTPAAKVQPSKAIFKSLGDSAGYALGVNIGTSLKFQDMGGINRSLITRSLNDVMNGKPSLIPNNLCVGIINNFAMQAAKEKAMVVIAQGEAFLEKNKLRPEVKTTASGLQYEIIKEGTGMKPAAIDTFVAHYRGTLIDGSEFESSFDKNPLIYPVNKVISGWTEGLQLMSVGSRYKFYIPYNLGYGTRGNPPVIPGGATLIFELELLDVKKAQ